MKTAKEILHDRTGMDAKNHPSVIEAMELFSSEQNKELRCSLDQAVLVIKQWHGKEFFDIYLNNAPEMKMIKENLPQ